MHLVPCLRSGPTAAQTSLPALGQPPSRAGQLLGCPGRASGQHPASSQTPALPQRLPQQPQGWLPNWDHLCCSCARCLQLACPVRWLPGPAQSFSPSSLLPPALDHTLLPSPQAVEDLCTGMTPVKAVSCCMDAGHPEEYAGSHLVGLGQGVRECRGHDKATAWNRNICRRLLEACPQACHALLSSPNVISGALQGRSAISQAIHAH